MVVLGFILKLDMVFVMYFRILKTKGVFMKKMIGLVSLFLGIVFSAHAAQRNSFHRHHSGVLKKPSAARLRSGSDDSLNATEKYDATALESAFMEKNVLKFTSLLREGALMAKHYCQTNYGDGLLWERVIERGLTDPEVLEFIEVLIRYDIAGINQSSTTFPLGTPLGMILHEDVVDIGLLRRLLQHKEVNSSLRMTTGQFVEEACTNEEAQALVQHHRNELLRQAIEQGQQCFICKKAVDDTAMVLSCEYDHRFHRSCLETHVRQAGIPRGWPNCPTCEQAMMTGDVAAICPPEEKDKIDMYESEGSEDEC